MQPKEGPPALRLCYSMPVLSGPRKKELGARLSTNKEEERLQGRFPRGS